MTTDNNIFSDAHYFIDKLHIQDPGGVPPSVVHPCCMVLCVIAKYKTTLRFEVKMAWQLFNLANIK